MNNQKLKIIHYNCRSIKNKQFELFKYMNKQNVDILCLNETFLNSEDHNFNHINHHTIIRNDRTHKKGGGIAMILKNNIKFNVIQKASNENEEYIAIEIDTPRDKDKLLLISTYVHPNSNTNFDFIPKFMNKYKNAITIGDMNAHHNSWYCNKNNKKGTILANIIENNNFIINNTDQSTTKNNNTIIDLCISTMNIFNHIMNFSVDKSLNLSDHWPIKITLMNISKRIEIKRTDWDKFNTRLYDLTSTNCIENISNVNDLERELTQYNQHFNTALAESTTSKSLIQNKINLPMELTQLIKSKKKLTREYKINLNPIIKNTINNLNNYIKRKIVTLKTEKWNSVFESLIKNKPAEKQFWQKINNSKKVENEPLPNHPKSTKAKTEFLADHFEKAFTNNCPKQQKSNSNFFKYYKSIKYNGIITIKEITDAIKKIKNTNSHGNDNISNRAIRSLSIINLTHIAILFNASLTLAHVPKIWKEAKLIIIQKKNSDPDLAKSYRPISIISCLGKILERIMNSRITKWFDQKNILIDEQSGFRKKRSTHDVIINLVDSVKNNFKEGKKTGAILYDFEKAFDQTPHNNILHKLHKLRCPSLLGLWIKSYLSDRTFNITIKNTNSTKRPVKASIPQGGCISANLFALYINDIGKKLRKIGVKFALFADDITIWYSHKNKKNRKKATISHKHTKRICKKMEHETQCAQNKLHLVPKKIHNKIQYIRRTINQTRRQKNQEIKQSNTSWNNTRPTYGF